jgi:hypothetical protein
MHLQEAAAESEHEKENADQSRRIEDHKYRRPTDGRFTLT